MSKLSIYSDRTEAWHLIQADALKTLVKLPDACVDAVLVDPPYGVGIVGERWDHFGRDASEAFERWTTRWAAEASRVLRPGGYLVAFGAPRTYHRLASGIEDAGLQMRDQLLWLNTQGMPKSRRLSGGFGTGLKPAHEPVVIARKPLEGTTPENLERYGTGALNIDATRIGDEGYWPANLALSHAEDCTDGSCVTDCPVRELDRTHPARPPSRLFLCAKASKQEREAGCEQLPLRSVQLYTGTARPARARRNTHPCVKPLELMRWLVRLLTPADGLVLDPFCGSGSTGAATLLEGRRFLGIEREGEYVDIACARLTHWAAIAAQEEVLP